MGIVMGHRVATGAVALLAAVSLVTACGSDDNGSNGGGGGGGERPVSPASTTVPR